MTAVGSAAGGLLLALRGEGAAPVTTVDGSAVGLPPTRDDRAARSRAAAVVGVPTSTGGHAGEGPPAARTAEEPQGWAPCPVAAAGGGGYVPGAGLARYVRARSPRCSAPGCQVPSTRCDLDHRTPWPLGPTCSCNLVPLCRRHHLAKHRFGWRVQAASTDPRDTTARWTSPLGQRVLVPAQPFLPPPVLAAVAGATAVTTTPAASPAHAAARVLETYPPGDPAAHDPRRLRALVAASRAHAHRTRRPEGRDGTPRAPDDDPAPF